MSVEAINGSPPDTAKPIEPVRPIFPLEKILTDTSGKDHLSSLKQIDLGPLFEKITEKESNTEAVNVILINNNVKMIKSEPILFREGHTVSVRVPSEEDVLGLVRYKPGSPTTMTDIIPLLGNPRRPGIATPFVIVVTSKENELYMRTLGTPWLSKDEIVEARKEWGSEASGKKIINRFVNEYDIAKFSGPANKSIVSRVIV